MGGAVGDFCPFVIACWRTHPTLGITIDRQSLNIDHSPADTLIRFSCTTYTQREGISHELVGIKSTYTVSVGYARQVDEINECVNLI